MPETATTHVYRHIIDYAVEDQILQELVGAQTSVLDIGTGATGRSALKARDRGAVVTSIEINVEAIFEFGDTTERQDVMLAAADLLRLPFADDCFDVVQVALHGFDYILGCTDRIRGLQEMRRVVKPSGHVVFNGFNPVGLTLAPSGYKRAMWKAQFKYLTSRRFLQPTMIDFNGLELNQAPVRVVTNQAAIAGLRRVSVRNLSGSTSDPRKVALFSKAPYYVFQRPA